MKKFFLVLAVMFLAVVGCSEEACDTGCDDNGCESDVIFNDADAAPALMDATAPANDDGTGTVQPGDEIAVPTEPPVEPVPVDDAVE